MDLSPSPATVNKVLIPVMRQIFTRPKLANALFGRDRWGNPFGDERYENPYPMLETMRAEGPVVYRGLYQLWFVMGHDEVQEVLNHPGASSRQQFADLMGVRPYSQLREETRSFFLDWMLVQDPPDHGRLRRLVNRAFTVRRVVELESSIAGLADELIAELPASGPIEIVSAFNRRLPVNVIGAMLGMPSERWSWAQALVPRLTQFLNPFERWDHRDVDDAVAEFRSYVLELADLRRAEPADDLITALVQAEDEGDRLTRDELVANVGLLFFAGMDTTSSQLGNALVALADFPDQRSLVRDNPDLWPNAVEELLRYDGPIGLGQRFATSDIELAGQTIPAGSNVAVMVPAGNRDPGRWDRPDQLVLDRPDPRPITFGHGAHHCLGHALARTELRIGLRALVDALGDYTIDRDRIIWRRDMALRGPIQLYLTPG